MEGVSLGVILLRWNGLLIAFGIVCGALLAALEAKRRFQDAEIVYYLFVPLTILGRCQNFDFKASLVESSVILFSYNDNILETLAKR